MNKRNRQLWSAAGYTLALSAVYFAVRHADLGWTQIGEQWRATSISHWVACLLLFVGHILMNAAAFSILIVGPGPSAASERCAYQNIWLASVLAKYVPGAVWQIVGRGALMSAHGLSVRTGVRAGIAEQLMSLCWCALIFLAAAFAFRGHAVLSLVLLGVACAAHFFPGFISKRMFYPAAVRRSCTASMMYGASMVPFTIGYLMLLWPGNWLELIAAVFGGTIAGTFAFFSPGGLGVRESVSSLLVSQVSSAQVLSGMAGARVLMVLAEVFTTILGLTRLRGLKL